MPFSRQLLRVLRKTRKPLGRAWVGFEAYKHVLPSYVGRIGTPSVGQSSIPEGP
jgi:hypothetical protein